LNELIRQLVDMSLPVFRDGPKGLGGFAGEVTRLNSDRQFKPFVYLNGRAGRIGVPLSETALRVVPAHAGTHNPWQR
jgi:hypothetical protein